MNQNSLISIIIPIYNAASLIKRCINSILVQTYKEYEIIIVDDGSTDNSLQVCQDFAKTYNNITVFHKENEGQTSARKYGLERSNGKYIYFVDADDYIPEDTLSFLYQKITSQDLDMVEGASISTFLGTEKVEEFRFPTEGIFNKVEHIKMMYRGECNNGTHAILYKRDLFNNNTFNIPYDVKTGEDFYLNLSLSLEANKVGLYNKIVYHYIENDQAITHYYKFTSIRPQEHLIESTRRELIRYDVFNLVQADFYKKAIYSIFVACLHNPSLKRDKYIRKISKEAIPFTYSLYDKILCQLLIFPTFLPLLSVINKIRKSLK